MAKMGELSSWGSSSPKETTNKHWRSGETGPATLSVHAPLDFFMPESFMGHSISWFLCSLLRVENGVAFATVSSAKMLHFLEHFTRMLPVSPVFTLRSIRMCSSCSVVLCSYLAPSIMASSAFE